MEATFRDGAVWRVEYSYTTPGEWELTDESMTAVAPTIKAAVECARDRLAKMAKWKGWADYRINSVSVADRWEAPQ